MDCETKQRCREVPKPIQRSMCHGDCQVADSKRGLDVSYENRSSGEHWEKGDRDED